MFLHIEVETSLSFFFFKEKKEEEERVLLNGFVNMLAY